MPDRVRENWGYPIFGVASVIVVPLTAYVWYRLFEKPFLPKPSAEAKPVLMPALAG